MSARRAKRLDLQRELAFASRRFNAWWEGYAFNAEAVRDALSREAAPPPPLEDPKKGKPKQPPPPGPMAPGAYDFARRAYFERLGATGFAYGRCRPLAFEPPPAWLDRQRLRLSALRSDLSLAILEAAPGRGGAFSTTSSLRAAPIDARRVDQHHVGHQA